MTSRISTPVRCLEIILASIGGGMLSGLSVGAGLSWLSYVDEWAGACAIGGVIGLLASPFMIAALFWRPLGRSFAIILPPTMLLAFLGVQTEHFILATMFIPVYVLTAFIARGRLPDIRTLPPLSDPDLCKTCCYSLKGQPRVAHVAGCPSRRCPECGHIEQTQDP